MSWSAPPDPLCNPPRLLHPDCSISVPPSLPVFLATCLRRVNVSSLHGFHDATKHCSLCERPMCDVPEWLPGEPRPIIMNSVMAERARAQNGFAARLQKTAFDAILYASEQKKQPSMSRQPVTVDHTCEPGYCECPIQVLTPGCKHYVGHECLETSIYAGQNRCVQCNTIWFRPTPLARVASVEAYPFPTQMRYWKDKLRSISGVDSVPTDEITKKRRIVKMISDERIKNLLRRTEGGVDYNGLVQAAAERSAQAANRIERTKPRDIIYPRGRSPTRKYF